MSAMKLFNTKKGNILEKEGKYFFIDHSWDQLINRDGLYDHLNNATGLRELSIDETDGWLGEGLKAPVGSQEVWAAGVTYLRSRNARMEESKESGGADLYDKVYEADRPELFF